jgi:general secretion pathway protein D
MFIFSASQICPLLPGVSSSFAEVKKGEKVTFNFVDVELTTITKFISEITGKNFIYDEKVKGKITIIAPLKLSLDDAFSLFTSVLEIKGFTLAPSGVNVYKIIPLNEAKQRGLPVTTERQPVNETYIARLISLKYISFDEALRFIQPVVSRDGYLAAFGPGNMLLVIDSGLNIEKILTIIETIDVQVTKEKPELVFLKNSTADVVAKILNDGYATKISGKAGQAQVEIKIVPDQRLNAVILFGDPLIRETMKEVITLLDVPGADSLGRINVVFLENADATELGKVLDGMIKGAQPGATPLATTGGITITPDKGTNALIVVASPGDFQNLSRIIKQLDKRRRQVYVEAMIVEASVNKTRALGAKWRAAIQSGGQPIAIGGFGTFDQGSLMNVLYGLQGASIGGMAKMMDVAVNTVDPSTGAPSKATLPVPGLAALFGMDDFNGVVNVLSTPQILTSDNKEAEIMVGENVPFISQAQSTTATATSGTIINSIQRQDVGITLRLTPQITEGNYVKLDLYQEISSVNDQSAQLTTSVGPTTTKRSTKTSVVVNDGQTVVISGLMQEKENETTDKIPLLGDIPLIGWLFKYKSTAKDKTNLLVFLTPHIIKESANLEKLTSDKKDLFARSQNSFVEGELLVKFKDNVTNEQVVTVLAAQGASVISFVEKTGLYQIRLPKGLSVEDAVKDFGALPEVKFAEPNYRMRINK